jgi:NTE family protein
MKKISLALGGGGIKGFSHIGVIRQLEKEGFEIAGIAGTSVGGLVGALYAAGYSTEELEKFSKELKFPNIFMRSHKDAPSLIGLQGLFKLITDLIGEKTFDDLKIPFVAISVDINSGREIIYDTGRLMPAMQATSAIPGLFPSVQYKNMKLVDGGILNPIPVSSARWLCPDDPLIAVSLSIPTSEWKDSSKLGVPSYIPVPDFIVHQFNQLRLGQAMQIFLDSTDIMTNMIAELRLDIERPDVLIRPEVYKYSIIDKVDVDEAIALGEQAVIEARDQIKSAFSVTHRVQRWLRPSFLKGRLLSQID